MDAYLTQSELYHHGVKGMKWGVRKAQNRLSKARKASARYFKEATDIAKSGNKRVAGSKGVSRYAAARRNQQRAVKLVNKLQKKGVDVKSLNDINKASVDAGKYYGEKVFNERLLDVATLYAAGLVGGTVSYAAGRNVYTKYKYKSPSNR